MSRIPILRESIFRLQQRSKKNQIKKLINSGLPPEMKEVLTFLVTGRVDKETAKTIKQAEERRKEIASEGDKKIPIWYSPKPHSAGNDDLPDGKPQPGEVLEFTMERIAKTGKRQKWGTALYLAAREFHTKTIVELGSCAGISTIYLASVPNLQNLLTVEGSAGLARIAAQSVQSFRNVEVINATFNEALDNRIPALDKKIDLAYIDGHHEKLATIYYFDRLVPLLSPGSVVIFDDISWSDDMRNAWNILCKRKEFSHSMDLGVIGLCVMKGASGDLEQQPRYWNLQPLVGKKKIGHPRGWQGK